VVRGDVTNCADLDRLYQMTADRFGKIHVLIANAGIARFSRIEEFTETLFDELCNVQFKGGFFTVQRALPFLSDGASIVLVSAATATSRGTPLMSVLTAAKAAVRSLARTFSAELLPRGIRVNVLSPGLIDTPLLTRDIGLPAGGRDEIARSALGQIPMKRLGTAQEVAKAALFLACSDSSYCLGAELVVDGGLCQI
jgi:NAD(P)-dependent dehydrogenase (short-subunit alcohol dehydrogenase family)